MMNPDMRKLLAENISKVQEKMADKIVSVLEKVYNKELYGADDSIDVELVSKVLKKLFDTYIDEMDFLILEFDHQDTPLKNMIDLAHGIERLNKGYINFTKTIMTNLDNLILEYQQSELQQVTEEPATVEPEIVVETPEETNG